LLSDIIPLIPQQKAKDYDKFGYEDECNRIQNYFDRNQSGYHILHIGGDNKDYNQRVVLEALNRSYSPSTEYIVVDIKDSINNTDSNFVLSYLAAMLTLVIGNNREAEHKLIDKIFCEGTKRFIFVTDKESLISFFSETLKDKQVTSSIYFVLIADDSVKIKNEKYKQETIIIKMCSKNFVTQQVQAYYERRESKNSDQTSTELCKLLSGLPFALQIILELDQCQNTLPVDSLLEIINKQVSYSFELGMDVNAPVIIALNTVRIELSKKFPGPGIKTLLIIISNFSPISIHKDWLESIIFTIFSTFNKNEFLEILAIFEKVGIVQKHFLSDFLYVPNEIHTALRSMKLADDDKLIIKAFITFFHNVITKQSISIEEKLALTRQVQFFFNNLTVLWSLSSETIDKAYHVLEKHRGYCVEWHDYRAASFFAEKASQYCQYRQDALMKHTYSSQSAYEALQLIQQGFWYSKDVIQKLLQVFLEIKLQRTTSSYVIRFLQERFLPKKALQSSSLLKTEIQKNAKKLSIFFLETAGYEFSPRWGDKGSKPLVLLFLPKTTDSASKNIRCYCLIPASRGNCDYKPERVDSNNLNTFTNDSQPWLLIIYNMVISICLQEGVEFYSLHKPIDLNSEDYAPMVVQWLQLSIAYNDGFNQKIEVKLTKQEHVQLLLDNLTFIASQDNQDVEHKVIDFHITRYRSSEMTVIPYLFPPPKFQGIKENQTLVHNVLELFINVAINLKDTKETLPLYKACQIFFSKENNRIVIEGPAGIGKSTICRFICCQWADEKDGCLSGEHYTWLSRFQLVLWIPLNELVAIVKGKLETIGEIIYQLNVGQLGQEKSLERTEYCNAIKDLNDANKLLLLIDGLDEIQAAYKENEDVQNVVKILLTCNNWLLTSRAGADKYLDSNRITHSWTAVGLDYENIKQYVKKFYDEFSSHYPDSKVHHYCKQAQQQLLERLEQSPAFRYLGKVPLSLEIMCSRWLAVEEDSNTHEGKDKQIDTKTALLQTLVDYMIAREYLKRLENQSKTINNKVISSAKKMYENEFEALKEIAFDSYAGTVISEKTDFSLASSVNFSSAVQEHRLLSVFLQPTFSSKENDYQFVCEIFQIYFMSEYLATALIRGQKIVYQNEKLSIPEFIIYHKYDPRYQSVWSFLSGLLNSENQQQFWYALLCPPINAPRDIVGNVDEQLIIDCLEETNNLDVLFTLIGELKQKIKDWLSYKLKSLMQQAKAFQEQLDALAMKPRLATSILLPELRQRLDEDGNTSAIVLNNLYIIEFVLGFSHELEKHWDFLCKGLIDETRLEVREQAKKVLVSASIREYSSKGFFKDKLYKMIEEAIKKMEPSSLFTFEQSLSLLSEGSFEDPEELTEKMDGYFVSLPLDWKKKVLDHCMKPVDINRVYAIKFILPTLTEWLRKIEKENNNELRFIEEYLQKLRKVFDEKEIAEIFEKVNDIKVKIQTIPKQNDEDTMELSNIESLIKQHKIKAACSQLESILKKKNQIKNSKKLVELIKLISQSDNLGASEDFFETLPLDIFNQSKENLMELLSLNKSLITNYYSLLERENLGNGNIDNIASSILEYLIKKLATEDEEIFKCLNKLIDKKSL